MSLRFRGVPIPGLWQIPVAEAPVLQVARTKYWGVARESELVGKTGGREIFATGVLFSSAFASHASLDAFLKKLDGLVGFHGELSFDNRDVQCAASWPNCTFHGFTPGGDPDGRDGPLQDVAGTLVEGKNVWWVRGELHWHSLGK